jgi:polysaccharide pyruvyl transferase WcaK-like protein
VTPALTARSLNGTDRSTTGPSANGAASAILEPARTIALFGLFGCGNMGNDASLEAMLEFLRQARPDARLICICDRPEIVGPASGITALPISASRRRAWPLGKLGKLAGKSADVWSAFRIVRDIDVMVIPGTGILDDFGEAPYGMPFDLLNWCLAARLAGTRVAMVSIGAGPIHHPLSRRLMTAAARLAHYRSYRDDLSRSYMESIGFRTDGDFVYPDIVFKLDEPASLASDLEPRDTLQVGLGVMSYYGWYGFAEGGESIFRTYVEKLGRFALHLLDRGHTLRLLTGEAGDRTAIDLLIQTLAAARPGLAAGSVTAEPIGCLRDLMRQIAQTDLVVATRFHNIVCALKMGKPTISLGYARKNDVLMDCVGLGAYCQHIESFDVDLLIRQFDLLAGASEEHAVLVRKRSAGLKQDLRRQEACLLTNIF